MAFYCPQAAVVPHCWCCVVMHRLVTLLAALIATLPTAIPCATNNGPITNGGTCATTASGAACDIDTLCSVGYEYTAGDPTCEAGSWDTNPDTLSCTGVPSHGEDILQSDSILYMAIVQ